MTEDFVYEDDPRLKEWSRTLQVQREQTWLIMPAEGGPPSHILRREPHDGSLKLLEVRKRKRPKPLVFEPGQRWKHEARPESEWLLVRFSEEPWNARTRWTLVHTRAGTPWNGRASGAPLGAFDLACEADPRDHGWALIE